MAVDVCRWLEHRAILCLSQLTRRVVHYVNNPQWHVWPPAAVAAAAAEEEEEQQEDYATTQAKRLILSLLPQSTLSPFPPALRPTHWDYTSSALSLYPLPHTLVLVDAEAKPFALTFEGCHVLNPGRFVGGGGGGGTAGGGAGRGARMQWVEYDCASRRGIVRGERVE